MPSVLLAFVRNVIGGFPILSVVLALAGGGFGTGAAVWAGKDWWFDHVSAPQIRQAQQQADAAAYEGAARAAQWATQLAKIAAVGAVMKQFQEQQAADDAAQAAELEALNKEIDSHERQLRKSGHSCPVTQSDIAFIGSLRAKP